MRKPSEKKRMDWGVLAGIWRLIESLGQASFITTRILTWLLRESPMPRVSRRSALGAYLGIGSEERSGKKSLRRTVLE